MNASEVTSVMDQTVRQIQAKRAELTTLFRIAGRSAQRAPSTPAIAAELLAETIDHLGQLIDIRA